MDVELRGSPGHPILFVPESGDPFPVEPGLLLEYGLAWSWLPARTFDVIVDGLVARVTPRSGEYGTVTVALRQYVCTLVREEEGSMVAEPLIV